MTLARKSPVVSTMVGATTMPYASNHQVVFYERLTTILLLDCRPEWSRIGTIPAPSRDYDPVFLDQTIEAGSGNVEDSGGLPLVALGPFQDQPELGPLRVGQRVARHLLLILLGNRGSGFQAQVFRSDHSPPGQDRGPGEGVLELSDVSGPVIFL